MAPIWEILSMLQGQAFGTTKLPNVKFNGKVAIVTGANTGLGLECVKHLVSLQTSHIILACRSPDKGTAAASSIYASTNCKATTKLEVWPLDLASHASVLAFGQRVRDTLPRLDYFIANAGVEYQEYKVAEGLEIHLTVNVISAILSALVCLPKMQSTAREFGVQTTITFAGSMYHIFGPDDEFDKGLDENVDMFSALSEKDGGIDIIWRYALSKLMLHLCAHEFAAAIAGQGQPETVVNIVNPGWCGTELSRAKPHPMGEKVWFALLGWTAEKGSRGYVDALVGGVDSHGKYFSECTMKPESAFVRSERGRKIQRKMWEDLVKRVRGISPEVAGFLG